MKIVLSDITSYFVSSYKEQLREYLENIDYKCEIKENVEAKNSIKQIHKTRPQSVDKKRYQGLSSEEYFKNKSKNSIENKYYNNYESKAFEAIMNDNIKHFENNIHINSQKSIVPNGFNQINQLNDPNGKHSKGLSDKIKGILPFFK